MTNPDPLTELAPFLKAARETGESFIPPPDLSERLLATRSTPVPEADLPRPFGPYTLNAILGAGASGTVYAAFDPQLNRHLALKILAPELAALPDSRERFLREGRAAASLHHDHLMPIFTVHEDTPLPALAAPLLHGETLQQKITREGPLPTDTLLTIARQITSALQHAHHTGILHRDIKPSNIFYETDTHRAIVMDFGLARSLDTPSDLTLSGTIAGTPEFLAPEQIDDDPNLTPATDLYSLGATLYTLAAGHPPFQAHSLTSLLKKVATDPPQPLTQLPTWLNQLILTLLSKKPTDRPQNTTTLLTLLDSQKTPSKKSPLPKILLTLAALTLALLTANHFLNPPQEPPFSLTQSLASATETITIPQPGLYHLDPLTLDRPLTLTATHPDTIIHFTSPTTPITTTHPLTLKNLTLRYDLPKDSPTTSLIHTTGEKLTLTHCRLEQPGRTAYPLTEAPLIHSPNPLHLTITHSALLSFRSPLLTAASHSTLTLNHSISIIPTLLTANDTHSHTLNLDHTTATFITLINSPPTTHPTQIHAQHSHLEANHTLLWAPNATLDTLPFTWTGENNTLATNRTWVSTAPALRPRPRPNAQYLSTFNDWQSHWQSPPHHHPSHPHPHLPRPPRHHLPPLRHPHRHLQHPTPHRPRPLQSRPTIETHPIRPKVIGITTPTRASHPQREHCARS